MATWFEPFSGASLNLVFTVVIGAIAVYWLWRVAREARRSQVPSAAWWAVAGLILLPLAGQLELDALFGVSAFLLLFAEYWPGAYRRSRTPPRADWALVGLAVGAVLLWETLRNPQSGAALLALAGGLLLAGGAGLLSRWQFRSPAARTGSPPAGLQWRWQRASTPEWPDLSVTLSEQGAHLKNISRSDLQVAGWSPVGLNAWYPVRSAEGRILSELRSGQQALLPVSDRDSGVRVWYAVGGQEPQVRLFKADWTPTARAAGRVLN